MTAPPCAYCPTFDPTNPQHAGMSHKVCPDCLRRLHQAMDAREAERGREISDRVNRYVRSMR